MKFMGANELRDTFTGFFEEKGHLKMESFPLVPKNDNSLLLINAGMAPLKHISQFYKNHKELELLHVKSV